MATVIAYRAEAAAADDARLPVGAGIAIATAVESGLRAVEDVVVTGRLGAHAVRRADR
jgi:hypothetical protein